MESEDQFAQIVKVMEERRSALAQVTADQSSAETLLGEAETELAVLKAIFESVERLEPSVPPVPDAADAA